MAPQYFLIISTRQRALNVRKENKERKESIIENNQVFFYTGHLRTFTESLDNREDVLIVKMSNQLRKITVNKISNCYQRV